MRLEKHIGCYLGFCLAFSAEPRRAKTATDKDKK